MTKKNYKDLHVWQKAVDLTEMVYIATENFPKREQLGLAAQIRKSVVSVASNIAEGSARGTSEEFKQFLIIARASAAELQTQLLISHRLHYLTSEVYVQLSKQLNEVGKMINGLLISLNKPLTTKH